MKTLRELPRSGSECWIDPDCDLNCQLQSRHRLVTDICLTSWCSLYGDVRSFPQYTMRPIRTRDVILASSFQSNDNLSGHGDATFHYFTLRYITLIQTQATPWRGPSCTSVSAARMSCGTIRRFLPDRKWHQTGDVQKNYTLACRWQSGVQTLTFLLPLKHPFGDRTHPSLHYPVSILLSLWQTWTAHSVLRSRRTDSSAIR